MASSPADGIMAPSRDPAFDTRLLKGTRLAIILSTLAAFLVGGASCAFTEVNKLRKDLEDSRAADAQASALADELDPASRARLETLGRTAAPTRYAERTETNRIRVVAFDFGGTELGQVADAAGNLLPSTCLDPSLDRTKLIRTTPAREVPLPGRTNDLDFYKGMFRQYGRQIGTTIDVEADIGPVGAATRVHFSNNFLVIEWRRYQLQHFADPSICAEPHVSAVELGIAVRIVFNVRLQTTDAKLSASFGIADLQAALARSEATVEVSYEVVGTTMDLLPSTAVIITSLNEYLESLKRFHDAVRVVRDAWRAYSSDGEKKKIGVPAPDGTGETVQYDVATVFAPEQLAYYVSGAGVGDVFKHLENVDVCTDLDVIVDYYRKRKAGAAKRIKQLKQAVDDRRIRRERARSAAARQERRDDAVELSQEQRKRARTQRQLDALDYSYAQNDCKRTLEHEVTRKAHACAVARDAKEPYFGEYLCSESEAADIEQATKQLEEQREQQRLQQQIQQQQQPPKGGGKKAATEPKTAPKVAPKAGKKSARRTAGGG